MPSSELVLRDQHIALDALLKATGVAPSGGEAKALIQSGAVYVDGAVETRRSAKIRAGQRVTSGGVEVRVIAPREGAAAG